MFLILYTYTYIIFMLNFYRGFCFINTNNNFETQMFVKSFCVYGTWVLHTHLNLCIYKYCQLVAWRKSIFYNFPQHCILLIFSCQHFFYFKYTAPHSRENFNTQRNNFLFFMTWWEGCTQLWFWHLINIKLNQTKNNSCNSAQQHKF